MIRPGCIMQHSIGLEALRTGFSGGLSNCLARPLHTNETDITVGLTSGLVAVFLIHAPALCHDQNNLTATTFRCRTNKSQHCTTSFLWISRLLTALATSAAMGASTPKNLIIS